jgi:hypothetical protein
MASVRRMVNLPDQGVAFARTQEQREEMATDMLQFWFEFASTYTLQRRKHQCDDARIVEGFTKYILSEVAACPERSRRRLRPTGMVPTTSEGVYQSHMV